MTSTPEKPRRPGTANLQIEPSSGVAWGGLAMLAAVAGFTVVLCLRKIAAIDFWWQLAAGDWVLRHGWPRTDPFSFAAPNAPWIELRWLWEIALHGLWAAGGAAAVILAKAAAVLATFGIALASTVTRRTAAAGAWLALLAVLAMNNRLFVRPELASYLFLAFFLFAIHRDRERGGRWTFALPAVQLLWVNAHPLFVFGPAVAGAWFVAEGVARLRSGAGASGRASLFRRSAVILGLCLAACLANPWFVRGAAFPLVLFHQLQGTAYSDHILELKSPFEFLRGNPAVPAYLVMLALAAATALGNLRRLDLFWTFVVAAFAYLSLTAIRNVPLFLIAAVPFVLLNLRAEFLWKTSLARVRTLLYRVSLVAVPASCLLLAWIAATNRYTAFRNEDRFGLGVNPYAIPAGAVERLEEGGVRGENVFCYLKEGSYLLYRGYRVYFDPRLEVYGEDHLRRYRRAVVDEAAWRALEEEYGLRVAVLGVEGPAEMALAKRLRDSGRWRIVSIDHEAVVLLASGFAPAIPAFDPRADAAGWMRRWRSVLPEPVVPCEAGLLRPLDPPFPYQKLGWALAYFGFEEAAEPFLRDALAVDPQLFVSNYSLGVLLSKRQDWEGAVAHLSRALERVPRGTTPDPEDVERRIAIGLYTARVKLHESRGEAEAAARDRERLRELAGESKESEGRR